MESSKSGTAMVRLFTAESYLNGEKDGVFDNQVTSTGKNYQRLNTT